MRPIKEKVKKISCLMKSSAKTVVLTGAGISTDSGIADFRSPGGIWSRFDPDVFTNQMLYSDPKSFYEKGLGLLNYLNHISSARPNRAHRILAIMEEQCYIDAIITQNIDGLHQKAGSKNVLEIHGNLIDCYCMDCKKVSSFSSLLEKLKNGINPPICDFCGGILRPSIVLFGDMLPDCYEYATELTKKSDLLLVIGSSLEVSPANFLLEHADKTVIINMQATDFDYKAEEVLHTNASEALSGILKELRD